eukprot:403363742
MTETKNKTSYKLRFLKLKKNLKLKLFNLIFEMHSIIHFNPQIAGVMLCIDYITNIVLIVYLRIVDLQDQEDELFITKLNLTGFVNETLFINEVNYGLNLFLVTGLIYFFIILFTTNPKKPRRKGQSWKINIMIIVLYSVHTCFSTLIIAAQTVNIFCPTSTDNFTCLKGSNVDSAIVSSLGIVAFLLNSYFIENIYNFQFMGINGETGILSNQKTFSLIQPLLKYFGYVIYFSALPDSITSIMFVSASLMYLVQLYLRFNQSYNFSKFLSEIEVTGTSICAFNYALCVMINALSFKMTNGDFLVAFLMNIGLANLVYVLKKNSWNNKLNSNFLAIKNIPAKEIYAYRMLECIMGFTFQDQLILSGLMKTHKNICQNKKCICSFENMMKNIKDDKHKEKLLEFKLSKAGIEYEKLLKVDHSQKDQKRDLYLEYQGSLNKIKNPQQLLYLNLLLNWLEISFVDLHQHRMRIIQSYIVTDILEKDLKALFLISTLQNTKLNIQEQFAIFCYQKIIFDKVNHRIRNLSSQSLDILQIQKSISTEKKLSNMYYFIEQTVNDCQLFWRMIANKERDLDFQKLHQLSMKISKSSLKADKVYRQIRELQPTYYNIIIIYYKFLKHVMNYENDSLKEQNELSMTIQKRRIQNLRSIEFQNELFDLNKKIGTIVLRASKKSMGRIAQVNNEILMMTRHKLEKLQNANISILFPSVMDEQSHNACLEHFFQERTSSNFINQKKNLWMKDQNGFIILVDFYVQPFYDQVQGLMLIAYIKQSETMAIKDQDVQSNDIFTILTDWKGKIQCGSQNLSGFLKFNNSYDLRNADLNIFQLCTQLDELSKDSSFETGVTTELILNELNMGKDSAYEDTLPNKVSLPSDISLGDLEQESIFTRSINFNISGGNNHERGFNFLKQRSMKINLKGDLRYLNNHKYFNFGVFYFSLIKKEKLNIKNDSIQDEQSENLDELKNQIDMEGTMTASSASSSNSKNLKQINNLKSEYEIKKAPRIIGIFQKLFVAYFITFLGLSLGIMIMSQLTHKNFMSDFEQYYNTRQAFYELVEIRKNVREYILLQTDQTQMSSTLVNNRKLLILYSIESKVQIMKTLTNKINDYILQHESVQNQLYSLKLQKEPILLQNIDQLGKSYGVEFTFVPGMQQLISKVQILLSQSSNQCNCYFRDRELLGQYNFKENERDFYFVDSNSVDILGRVLYQSGSLLQEIIHNNSHELSQNLLYLVIPGIFISVLCSIVFFPVLIKMINNRKSVIQLLARIKITSSQQSEKKLKRFMQDLAQNKNKKRDFVNYEIESDEEVNKLNTQQQQETLQQQNNDSLILNRNFERDLQSIDSTTMERINNEHSILEQSLSQKQLIQAKIKNGKSGLTVQQKDEIVKFQQKQQSKLFMINRQIDQQFSKQKVANIIKILLLSLVYCMFFVALYFLNTEGAQSAPDAVSILQNIQDRGPCLSAVPLYTRQRLISNRSVTVGFLDSNIDALFNYCIQNSNEIQDLRKNSPRILSQNDNVLSHYEGANLCQDSDMLINQDSTLNKISPKKCSTVINGIMKYGLQQSYSYILAEFRKYEIQFEISNYTQANLQSLIQDGGFIEFQDAITLYLKPVIKQYNEIIYETIVDYYQNLMQRSIIFFVVFVIVLFGAIILIIVFLLQIIQRELYFNKKIIKFIPIEELQRKSMTKILKAINF